MAFNLKKILRALLFSTSDALTIKDIQAVITRYHNERENMKKAAKNGGQPEVPEALVEGEQSEMEDIMAQVPTLLTATQIREAMEEISAELEESGDVCRLLQSSSASSSPFRKTMPSGCGFCATTRARRGSRGRLSKRWRLSPTDSP